MNAKLAIVIPYYKIAFFETLLERLAQQTNRDFHVYIGDDCSPDDPKDIIAKYQNRLSLTYKRYEENMGGTNLVGQWGRCVELIGDEEWVWFLPDDDLPSKNFVEAFYRALPNSENHNVRIFRSQSMTIDENGQLLKEKKFENPELETNLEFYTRLLHGKTRASLGDNIFNRRCFEESGGFVAFPKAWGSDHATILKVSAGGNIFYLHDAVLYFRNSGENISSALSDGDVKMYAKVMFAKWLKKNESIFPAKPDEAFYKYLYWRMEYPVVHTWEFSIGTFVNLYRLRKECFRSGHLKSVVVLLAKKIFYSIKKKFSMQLAKG